MGRTSFLTLTLREPLESKHWLSGSVQAMRLGSITLSSTQRWHAAVILGRTTRTAQASSPSHSVTDYNKYSGELQSESQSPRSALCFYSTFTQDGWIKRVKTYDVKPLIILLWERGGLEKKPHSLSVGHWPDWYNVERHLCYYGDGYRINTWSTQIDRQRVFPIDFNGSFSWTRTG